ncbi:MAG: putative 3-phenylpropionic acid transporter [Chloroflexi bacterium ADurb.Bin325]|nr:MAG: putative 3-phenylpropionic acid transporter [Chloroflexi bacterium ADurb.Bin325]
MDSLLLLTLIIALVFAAIGISSPLMTLYLEALGASYAQIAVILATVAAVSLFSSYGWGRASDALGRRKPLIVAGLGGLIVTYLLLSQATSATAAWVVRLIEAAFAAAYSTASLAFVGDLLAQRDRRGQRMGTYRGIGSLAFAGGAFVGGRLADALSLRTVFIACAVLYALAAGVALLLRETRVPPIERAAATAEPGARSAPASMWPNYMATLGHSNTTISTLWGLAGLVEAPALRLTGQLSDVMGRSVLLAAGGIGAAVVMLGYILLSRLLPALVGVQVVRGVVFAAYTGNAMTFAVESADASTRGRHSGLFNTVTGAGQLAGLLLGGTLAQTGGFPFMFAVFGAAGLLAGVCFLLLRGRASVPRPPLPKPN